MTLGAVKTDDKVEVPSSEFAFNWKRLLSGETIDVKRVGLGHSEQVGVQVTDWLGRSHVVFHPSLDVKAKLNDLDDVQVQHE